MYPPYFERLSLSSISKMASKVKREQQGMPDGGSEPRKAEDGA